MRLLLRLALVLGLVMSLLATPGLAQEETVEEEETIDESTEEEDEPEPIDMSLYLHGESEVGEAELAEWLLGDYRRMDEEEPTDSNPKGMWATNYAAGPNTNCSGNGLLPTWEAFFEGTITDDLSVTLHTLAGPAAELQVRLFADVPASACNENYIEAVAETTVDVDPGEAETEIVFEDVDIPVRDNLVLMVNAASETTQARVHYDAVPVPSRVDLTCIPLTDDVDTCLW